ncbi:MAG: hypothetical protein OSB02_12745 [Rhodospirillaceae bacterium]|jgi:CheY-like chemotaxis protein|nr:hypothetical protein [Rhodospirillaceae bacterium]
MTKLQKAGDKLTFVRVIAVTAFAMKRDNKKLEWGRNGYIAKPISIFSLWQKILKFLDVP